jgi:hypothetical protein
MVASHKPQSQTLCAWSAMTNQDDLSPLMPVNWKPLP